MKSRLFFISAALTLFLSACQLSLAEDITPPPNYQSPTPGPTMSPLFPPSAPNLVSGAAIFAEKCAPCHGDKGLGDGPMAAQLQKAPSAIGKPEIGRMAAPANWFTTVTQGNINSFMPPFNGSLSDQQRWDTVAFAISLGGSTAAEAERGRQLYETNCTKCHGPAGNAVQSADFTDQALMAKLTQADISGFINKGVGQMPGLGGLLSEADIFAIASYVRTFSFVSVEAAVLPSATPQAPEATATLEITPTTGVTAVATTDLTQTAGNTSQAPEATATQEIISTPAGTAVATADLTQTPGNTPQATGAAAPATTPAVAAGNIGGKITNGSGGTLPSNLKAVLHIFEHDPATQQVKELSTLEAPVSADGAYQFEQVPMPANRAFLVSVNYANTNYESSPVVVQAGQTTMDLPLTIYDTTTDTSSLEADQAHILLDYSKPDVVQVVEFLIITNSSNKSVIAAEKGGPVVKVPLPKGYANLQFEQGAIGDRYLKTDDGFADTTSVTPGEPGTQKYTLVFAIDLALPKPGLFGGQKLEFTQPVTIKINGLSVLAPEGVNLEGSNFTPGGLQDMGTGVKYQIFTGGSLEAGKSLQITASGAPNGVAQPAASANPNQNIIIGVGAFGLVLILAGLWLYWRDRNRTEPDDELDFDDEEDDDGDEGNADEIMDAIVALDDQFKAGNIQETAYKERRAELKDSLKKLL